MMELKYKTHGTCSQQINVDIEDGVVKDVEFIGGCRGYTQGVAALAKVLKVEDVIDACEGLQCRKETSCPDQLAQALKSALSK